MTLYPDVQKAAQAELDALLGGERLPDFGDKTRLPYVTAILKEVLRWILFYRWVSTSRVS